MSVQVRKDKGLYRLVDRSKNAVAKRADGSAFDDGGFVDWGEARAMAREAEHQLEIDARIRKGLEEGAPKEGDVEDVPEAVAIQGQRPTK